MRLRVRYQASAIEAREGTTTEVRVLDPAPRFGHRLPSFVLACNAALVLGASVRRVSDWSVHALPQQTKRSSLADDSQRNDLDTFDLAVQVAWSGHRPGHALGLLSHLPQSVRGQQHGLTAPAQGRCPDGDQEGTDRQRQSVHGSIHERRQTTASTGESAIWSRKQGSPQPPCWRRP